METRYFVKFIGDKNVTLALAHTESEAEILVNNQFEETTAEFYEWVRSQTSEVRKPQLVFA